MDEISIAIPLDDDGFLRRQCPTCGRQFKWYASPVMEEAEDATPPSEYFCPLCGTSAGIDEWHTEQQIEYAIGTAAPDIMRELEDELRDSLRQPRDSFIQVDISSENVGPPSALTEHNDMSIVMSPCHPDEPVKVPDDLPGPFFCLVCGERFVV